MKLLALVERIVGELLVRCAELWMLSVVLRIDLERKNRPSVYYYFVCSLFKERVNKKSSLFWDLPT